MAAPETLQREMRKISYVQNRSNEGPTGHFQVSLMLLGPQPAVCVPIGGTGAGVILVEAG